MRKTHLIAPAQAGQRLDWVFREIYPEYSLRAARRLLQAGQVLLNGSVARASIKVESGDRLELRKPDREAPELLPRFLERQGDYCCYWKPPRLHTASLSGGGGASLEALLPELCHGESALLLQRLDYGTSGIVCAALAQGAAGAFRKAEKNGQCVKSYYALLEGRLVGKRTVDKRLAGANRKKVRVLEASGGRASVFEPLQYFGAHDLPGFAGVAGKPFTLALCRLCAGQRHQLRAHAAYMGHPLAGDGLYGASCAGNFMLEHFRLEFPGHIFQLPRALSIFREFPPFNCGNTLESDSGNR